MQPVPGRKICGTQTLGRGKKYPALLDEQSFVNKAPFISRFNVNIHFHRHSRISITVAATDESCLELPNTKRHIAVTDDIFG
jgi:hypothetical protein